MDRDEGSRRGARPCHTAPDGTHGQSEIGFGVTRLLNIDLLLRIKQINRVKLYLLLQHPLLGGSSEDSSTYPRRACRSTPTAAGW